MPDNLHNDIPNEILQETLKLINEMLKDPEIAGKAIRDRNILIKGLKADIEHRKAAFKEAECRYVELLDKLNDIERCNDLSEKLIEENKKMKEELDLAKGYLNNSYLYKVNQTLEKIPGVIGVVLRFFFTGPVAKFSFMALFCILFIASITGWGFVSAALLPLAKLIGTIFGLGD
jgi:hypothetical protein